MAPPMPPALTPVTKSPLDDRPLIRMVLPVTLPEKGVVMIAATPPPPASAPSTIQHQLQVELQVKQCQCAVTRSCSSIQAWTSAHFTGTSPVSRRPFAVLLLSVTLVKVTVELIRWPDSTDAMEATMPPPFETANHIEDSHNLPVSPRYE